MKWVVRILAGLIAVTFISAGIPKITGSAEIVDMFSSVYGYGEGMVLLTGALELIAGIALIVGFWKKPIALVGSALAAFVMIGGVVSQMMADLSIVAPLVFAVLAVIVFIGTKKEMDAN